MDPQLKLIRLQKKLTAALREDVDRLLGATPVAVRLYERFYKKEFSQSRVREVPKTDLLRELRNHEVIFVSDFHTDPQSQRTALRLLRDIHQVGEDWTLGLELVPSHEQAALDLLFQKKLTPEKFLKRVQYDRNWGFPWSNYEPLVLWAVENRVRLLALDRPRELFKGLPFYSSALQEQDLKERDRWAAGIITDHFAHHRLHSRKKLRMLVLFGELHVAQACLPRQLKTISKPYLGKALSTVRVFQNHDALFWQLAARGKLHQKDVTQLSRDAYCIFSTTPWNKLQSLLSWAEGEHLIPTQEEPGDEDDWDSLGSDWTAVLKTHLETISEYFSVQLSAARMDELIFLTVENADFQEFINPRLVHTVHRHLIRDLVHHNERFYFPKTHLMWAASPSYTGISDLAGQFLMGSLNRRGLWYEPTAEGMAALILRLAFSFMASLVIHPKRKCDLPLDHRERIQQIRLKKKEAFSGEKEAREKALHWIQENPHPRFRKNSDFARYMSCKYAAHILGRQIYWAILEGKAKPENIRNLFFNPSLNPLAKLEQVRQQALQIQMQSSKSDIF